MKNVSVSENINLNSLIEKIKPINNCHKGVNGRVLVIGGSKDYFGAPVLACLTAFKFVDVVGLLSVMEVIRKVYHPEIICFSSGKEYLGREDVKYALEIADRYDVVLMGNGLGVNDKTREFVNLFLENYKGKVVLDADALKVADYVKLKLENSILTPNNYEYKNYIRKYEKEILRENVVLVKGREDVIKYKDKEVKVVGGSSTLCKAGTGDVLAGLIAGIYAHILSAFESTILGSYLMKKVSLVLEKEKGFVFTPLDLMNNIEKVLH